MRTRLYADSLENLRCRIDRLREAADAFLVELDGISEGMLKIANAMETDVMAEEALDNGTPPPDAAPEEPERGGGRADPPVNNGELFSIPAAHTPAHMPD